MEAGSPNELSQALTFSLQGFNPIKFSPRSGTSSHLDEVAMLRHLRRAIAMDETGRLEKIHCLAGRKPKTRARGAAELLLNRVPQIL